MGVTGSGDHHQWDDPNAGSLVAHEGHNDHALLHRYRHLVLWDLVLLLVQWPPVTQS